MGVPGVGEEGREARGWGGVSSRKWEGGGEEERAEDPLRGGGEELRGARVLREF